MLAIVLQLGLAAPPAACEPSAGPARAPDAVDALHEHLLEHPEDVDARLALATQLARLDRRGEARREAREVVLRAPEYADAYILLARLDAWDGDFTGATGWMAALAEHQPLDVAQRFLQADFELWAGHIDNARSLLRAISEPGASIFLRLARVELVASNTWQAHELARQAMAAEPENPQAREIFDETRRVLVGVNSYLGRYPTADSAQQLAAGVAATFVVFPRARFSVTGQYELDHRFATTNQRLSVRSDWRLADQLTATAYVRSGWVTVVPKTTAYGSLLWEPSPGRYVSGRYTLDVMTWPGQLHRLTIAGGIELVHHLRIDAATSAGMFDYCGKWSVIQSYEAQLGYVRQRWQVGVKVARGVELDRPLLPGFLLGMTGSDACPVIVGSDTSALALEAIQTYEVALLPSVQLDRRSTAGLSYTYEYRLNGAGVHIAGISLRRSF